MRKPFLLYSLVALAVSVVSHASAQSPTLKTAPEKIIDKPASPASEELVARSALADRQREARRLYIEGTTLAESGKFTVAVDHFEQAVRLDPDYADAYSALGRAYFKLQQWQKASANLRRATELHAKQRATQGPVHPTISIQPKENIRNANISKPPSQDSSSPSNARATALTKTDSANDANIRAHENNSGSGQVKAANPTPGSTAPATNAHEVERWSPIENELVGANRKNLNPAFGRGAGENPGDDAMKTSDAVSTVANRTPSMTFRLDPNVKDTVVKAAPSLPGLRGPEEINLTVGEVRTLSAGSEIPEAQPVSLSSSSSPSTVDENTGNNTSLVGIQVSMSEPPPMTAVSSAAPVVWLPTNADNSLTKIYRVGPGDVLDIRMNEAQPSQSTLFTVTPSGFLEHPTLAEPLQVSGFTVDEINAKIESDLKKRALMDDPKVAVGVRDYASHSILVSGLVKEAGAKFLRREAIPLYVVVADAQPLPEAATVTVMRNESGRVYEIDLLQTAEMNLLVRPGDVVTVRPNLTQFVYIGGEVKAPGEKMFRRGLTLMQAIISAGGVTPKSKLGEIGRDDGNGFLVATRFTLKDIQSGKIADPLLKPGDRVTILK